MVDSAQPLLFEATSRPRQSLGDAGMRVVAVVLALGFGLSGILFLILGAWPVLGFAGAELLLVLGLLGMQRARASRCVEQVSLGDGQLSIRRVDGGGRTYQASLDPYWAKVRLAEDGGRLVVGHRGQETEIGLFLNADEKRDLARALTGALRRYREPRFDNPQLS
jgi:uncharacterized membrane protein